MENKMEIKIKIINEPALDHALMMSGYGWWKALDENGRLLFCEFYVPTERSESLMRVISNAEAKVRASVSVVLDVCVLPDANTSTEDKSN